MSSEFDFSNLDFPLDVIGIAGRKASEVAAEGLNHQFVMFKTEKWLYVVAKGTGGCECFRGTHDLKDYLLKTQQQYDRTRHFQSDPTPKVWKEDKGIEK